MNANSVAKPARRRNQTLAMRLNQAAAAVPALKKLGDSPEYDYVFASQVFEAFRKELFVRDIMLLPDELECIERDFPTMAGPVLNRVQLKTEYEIIDCLGKDQSIVKRAFGVGLDHGDKALYIAKTMTLKYFFRILGLIPWLESDNAEANALTDDLTSLKTYEQRYNQRAKKQRIINDRQRRAFDAACHESGKTAEQVADYLKTKWHIPSITDMMQGDFNDAIKWAAGSGELQDDIVTSIESAKAKKATASEPAQPIKVVTQ